jgi:hypothetical protein
MQVEIKLPHFDPTYAVLATQEQLDELEITKLKGRVYVVNQKGNVTWYPSHHVRAVNRKV